MLDELQAEQQPVLEARGTADKGREVVLARERYKKTGVDAGLTDVSALEQRLKGARVAASSAKDKIRLRFTVMEGRLKGVISTHYYVDVAYRLGGIIEPIGRFDAEEAKLMSGMLDKVEAAVDTGELPHLAQDAASIIDPSEASAFD